VSVFVTKDVTLVLLMPCVCNYDFPVSGVGACDCNYYCLDVVRVLVFVTKIDTLVLLVHCGCNYYGYGFWHERLLL
jgi:hypothetical protein